VIDLEQKYTNKRNDEIKLSHIDRGSVYGWVKIGIDWCPHQWDEKTGELLWYALNVYDLAEEKPRIKRTVWVNVYKDCISIHSTKDFADVHYRSCGRADFHDRGGGRIACVKVEKDCEEGEGL
jgi:hypothetical protein